MIRKIALGAGAAALAAAGFLVVAPTATAEHWTSVETVSGNPTCEGGLKIEPVTSGEYGPINLTVTGSTISFTTDPGFAVSQVIVKGGPAANIYTYDPPTTSDTGLHAPEKNGKSAGLSHLCFFFDEEPKPTPTPEPPK